MKDITLEDEIKLHLGKIPVLEKTHHDVVKCRETVGRRRFYLPKDVAVYPDESVALLRSVIWQAVTDWAGAELGGVPKCYRPTEQELEDAIDLIFDDNYCLQWGNLELTSEELFSLVDLDRDRIRKLLIDASDSELRGLLSRLHVD